MTNDVHKAYILDKYKVDRTQYGLYMKIDAMSEMISNIKQDNLAFKGALNLMINHEYIREKMTRDADFSIYNDDFQKGYEKLISNVKKIKHEIYSYKIVKENRIPTSTGIYEGMRFNIQFQVQGGTIKDGFHVDVAVEELDVVKGFIEGEGIKYYSIERTLADKYVTMIQRGYENTREKDFIDLKQLFPTCNKVLFYELSGELIKAREVGTDSIEVFKEGYLWYPFVISQRLRLTLKEINEQVIN